MISFIDFNLVIQWLFLEHFGNWELNQLRIRLI